MNELEKLFEEYRETEFEFANIERNWSVKKECQYVNGIVLGKVREKDEKTILFLKKDVSIQELIRQIKIYEKRHLRSYEKSGQVNTITHDHMELAKGCLIDIENMELEDFILKHMRWVDEETDNFDEKCKILYLYYAYENYKHEIDAPYYRGQKHICIFYNTLREYEKFQLVGINETRELFVPIQSTRIHDVNLDKTFSVQNLPKNVAELFIQLMKEGFISELSVRLSDGYEWNGKYEEDYALEEVEYGKPFTLSGFQKIPITKLYSKNLGDSLWIHIDDKNITFEELKDDFDTFDENIITQVLHIEYFEENGKCYIAHMDHEYIFYTIDEYEKRTENHRQKGTGMYRIKTFKIDNSKIPLDMQTIIDIKDENGEVREKKEILLIHFIIENYFEHTDLLREYFQECY